MIDQRSHLLRVQADAWLDDGADQRAPVHAGTCTRAPHTAARAGEAARMVFGQVQIEQANAGELTELVQVAGHRRKQGGQVAAHVVHRERDLDFATVVQPPFTAALQQRAVERRRERRGLGFDAQHPGPRTLLDFHRLARQFEEGAGGLFARNDLRHLLQRIGTFHEIARREFTAGAGAGVEHDHGYWLPRTGSSRKPVELMVSKCAAPHVAVQTI